MEHVPLSEFVELDWGFVHSLFRDWYNHPTKHILGLVKTASTMVPAYSYWHYGGKIVEFAGRRVKLARHVFTYLATKARKL